jgi:hypothetical protein
MSEIAEEANDSLTTGSIPEHRAICQICISIFLIAPQQIQCKDTNFLNIKERFENYF